MEVAALADLLHETADHHGTFEAVAPPHDWWDWYAAYLHARQAGSTPDEADAAAGRYMAEVKHVVSRPLDAPAPAAARARPMPLTDPADITTVRSHHERQHQAIHNGVAPAIAVLEAPAHRPPQPRLLPRDVRPPADQHHHRDDRRGARPNWSA